MAVPTRVHQSKEEIEIAVCMWTYGEATSPPPTEKRKKKKLRSGTIENWKRMEGFSNPSLLKRTKGQ